MNTPPELYAHKASVLERHCAAEGRDPKTIARSMMVFVQWENLQPRWMTRKGAVAESLDQLIDVVGKLGELGLEEMQFQHFNFDDDSVPEFLANDLQPMIRDL